MRTLCILHAPPRLDRTRPTTAVRDLVGLEFEEDYDRVARILVEHPYIPIAASFFACVDVQVILEQLRQLRRHAALAYWTEFACYYPLLYIPRLCCVPVETGATVHRSPLPTQGDCR